MHTFCQRPIADLAGGHGQYREPSEALARYLDDPYADPNITREPLTDEVEVVVIGRSEGKMAGLELR